ncbi:hypothetical protein EJ04DRAFT_97487 [Polyplosphaeria fusca]|uniref:Uncharacterized protein n=1 Tax=Polyplosphaeria fusca TaxID=682080 RepID=A0A9P4UVR1_9PLEO|nr:hypothetical protein EJ04DRAFT_97487 [Polyplosphaeria fusca]
MAHFHCHWKLCMWTLVYGTSPWTKRRRSWTNCSLPRRRICGASNRCTWSTWRAIDPQDLQTRSKSSGSERTALVSSTKLSAALATRAFTWACPTDGDGRFGWRRRLRSNIRLSVLSSLSLLDLPGPSWTFLDCAEQVSRHRLVATLRAAEVCF